MLFTAATGYALQALAALQDDGPYVMAKDLAATVGLPAPYLAKILQVLARTGLLESVRGPGGGFRLARPAHHITVGDVLAAMEGEGALDACTMGFPACDAENPCPMHDAWSAVKERVHVSMTDTSLRDLQLIRLRRTPVRTAGRA